MADELVKLIDCLEKAAGTRMPDEIKTSLLARAKAIMDEQGLKPIAASRAALQEYLNAVQQDIAQVEAAMKPPAEESVEAKYAKMVAGPPDKEDYLYHAAHPGLKDKILTEGTAPGSWFAKTPQEASAFAGDVRADKAYFRVKKEDVKDVPAGQEDVFGQEFQKAGVFRRSGEGHQVEEVDQYGNPIKAGEATSPAQQQVKAEQTGNLDKFLKDVEAEQERERDKIRAIASPTAVKGVDEAKRIVSEVKSFVSRMPEDSPFRMALLENIGRGQELVDSIMKLTADVNKRVTNPKKREGITNWIQAGGDRILLGQRAQASKNLELRKGYQAAANLNPEEIAVAQDIIRKFEELRQRAIHYGIPINLVPNYVNQIWDLSPGHLRAMSAPKRLSEYFRFRQHRTFDSYFDGEQKGYKPKSKDISELISVYMAELGHAINARIFVQQMAAGVASDGLPLLSPFGTVKPVTDPKTGATTAYLAFPHAANPETTPETGDGKRYEFLNQPALRAWKWAGKDDQGNPIFMHSDLWVHPEIAGALEKMLRNSGLRNWWNTETKNPFLNMGKGLTRFLLDEVQPGMKAALFSGFSPFHQVQEGWHAMGHKVNPFQGVNRFLVHGEDWVAKEIDLTNPEQIAWVRHGLMLRPDRVGQLMFSDSVLAKDKNYFTRALRKFGPPGRLLADLQDRYSAYLFESYIPGLKLVTAENIFRRNKELFKDDLAAGEVTLSQVMMLSADQANAAYGELNWKAMGYSETQRHALQSLFIAPDFFYARAKFAAQAAKGIPRPGFTGDYRTGYEQFAAMMRLALGLSVAAQVMNILLNGKFDPEDLKHPFDIRYKNRRYGVRSVPGDLFHLVSNPRGFFSGRLSPVVGKGLLEWASGVNWRREPVESGDVIADVAFGVVPLPVQAMIRGIPFFDQISGSNKNNPVSPIEQWLGAAGVVIHRYSPLTEIYPMANDWMKENDSQHAEKAVFPISKYQQLRYALEDNDDERALTEARTLQNSGMTAKAIVEGFRESMKKPFTGSSLENEKKFYLSLDVFGRAKYDAALDRRAVIIQRFDKLIPSGEKPITRRTLLNRIFKE